MIVVIDYGMGNLRSVQKAFEFLGHTAEITSDPKRAAAASHLVLPGDAAFGDAMRNLNNSGWSDTILKNVETGKPFLGICVGLQLMFTESEEMGQHKGLNLLPGRVVRFPPTDRVPQIGWNQIHIRRPCDLLHDVPDASFYYFVHSYYVDGNEADVIATTDYSIDYTSIAGHDGVYGVQFHPEKSQQHGLKILDNFARMG